MHSNKKAILITSLIIFLLAFHGNALAVNIPGAGNCPSGTMVTVLMNYIETLHNIFPIKLGGITVLNFDNLEDHDDSGASIVCLCNFPPPIFYRVGIPLHLWEAVYTIETVQQPWCSPTLGLDLSLSFNALSIGDESDDSTQNDKHVSAQAHLIKYPIWWLLGLFLDDICFQGSGGLDYLYVTELDPCYNDSSLCVWMEPERLLFANQVAQLICPIDCAASTMGFPLDFLFWCTGCWHGPYPMSKEIPSVDYIQANAGLAAKFIAKMHRELIMWLTSGPFMLKGYCVAFPSPIWKKTQYNLLELYPQRMTNRMPIGRSSKLWGIGKSMPFQTNYVWGVYRARDCCAL